MSYTERIYNSVCKERNFREYYVYPAHGIEFDNNLMKEVLEMCDIYHTLLILIYIYTVITRVYLIHSVILYF